jgi:copper(I)-binding protein
MLNRTSRLLCAGALVLTPALASCSTEMPTDAIYTQAAGVNERSLDVDVLNAMVVSSEKGSGTLVMTLVNNLSDPVDGSASNADKLTGVTVDGKPAKVSPVSVPASGIAVVATRNDAMPQAVGGIKVTGDFQAGEHVDLVLTFQKAGEVELEVPVLLNEEGSYVAGQDGEPIPLPSEAAGHGEEGGHGATTDEHTTTEGGHGEESPAGESEGGH